MVVRIVVLEIPSQVPDQGIVRSQDSTERSWFKVSRFCYMLMKYCCDRRQKQQMFPTSATQNGALPVDRSATGALGFGVAAPAKVWQHLCRSEARRTVSDVLAAELRRDRHTALAAAKARLAAAALRLRRSSSFSSCVLSFSALFGTVRLYLRLNGT